MSKYEDSVNKDCLDLVIETSKLFEASDVQTTMDLAYPSHQIDVVDRIISQSDNNEVKPSSRKRFKDFMLEVGKISIASCGRFIIRDESIRYIFKGAQ